MTRTANDDRPGQPGLFFFASAKNVPVVTGASCRGAQVVISGNLAADSPPTACHQKSRSIW
jgi:hypothetical protein